MILSAKITTSATIECSAGDGQVLSSAAAAIRARPARSNPGAEGTPFEIPHRVPNLLKNIDFREPGQALWYITKFLKIAILSQSLDLERQASGTSTVNRRLGQIGLRLVSR